MINGEVKVFKEVPSYAEILPYIEKKLISEQSHPEDPNVRIFNYTQLCQFSHAWDKVTTQCRGLILNVETGEILARPFPKFFNYGEWITKGIEIPKGHPLVTQKLDGSLGIMYTLNGRTQIATRGSFTSDQALWATKWLETNVRMHDIPYGIDKNITHLFEIIYPENRIVVNYDFSGLVHLDSIEIQSGNSIGSLMLMPEPIREAREIPVTDIDLLCKMDEPNSEGFVIYYPKENVRMKIKFPEYVRLHKLVTGVSEIAIWEHLRDGKDLNDLLNKVPDEFFNWVRSVQEKLKEQYISIYDDAFRAYYTAQGVTDNRKDQAEIIKKMTRYTGVAFSILDDKNPSLAIWRIIRPKGQSGFKNDIDS